MSRWNNVVAACCSTAGVLLSCTAGDERIDSLHSDAVVWDTHNDLSYRVLYEGLDIGQRLPGGHVDIPRLQEGGVDVQTVALYIENFLYPHPGECVRQTRELLSAMRGAIEQNSDRVEDRHASCHRRRTRDREQPRTTARVP